MPRSQGIGETIQGKGNIKVKVLSRKRQVQERQRRPAWLNLVEHRRERQKGRRQTHPRGPCKPRKESEALNLGVWSPEEKKRSIREVEKSDISAQYNKYNICLGSRKMCHILFHIINDPSS